ncbi:MAG: TonB-dependent receptor [Thermoanaerobaculia bacterium]|nr:TonB-dependent receptor [Thermoanaerobaculia bacterium]
MFRASRTLFLFGACALLSGPLLAAFEVRLSLPGGGAAAGFSVSVVGQPVTVITDIEGRLRLDPAPALPFTLVATSPSGETSAPFEVSDLAAGEIELPDVLRESVTVISGVAPSLDLLPGSVATVLTREELEQRAPQRLYQALESIAGASKLGDGADSVPALRNLGRGRTLILIDGARVTAERRAGPSATFVDPASLGSVEVVRGPGSVIYGSDAFGGVLNAVTRDPEMDRSHTSYGAEGSFESSDELSGFVAGSTPVGSGALLVEGHYRDAGNFAAGGGEEIDNSSYTSFGGALRYVVPTSTGRWRLGLALDRVDDMGKAAIDSQQIRAYYPDEDSDRLTASWLGAVGSWDAVEAAAFYGTYDTVLDRDRAPTATSNRRIDRADTRAKDASARLVAGRSLAGGRFQGGLDLATRFDLESVFSQIRYADDATTVSRVDRFPAIDDAQKADSGLFATWTRPVTERISLGLGARGDYVESENRGGFFGDHSTAETAFSGNVALSFGPFAGWTSTAQVARGFRTPTLSDLYFRGPSGRGFVTGNPDLEAEESLQFDLGTRWRKGRTAIGLFAYRYEIDNLIERYAVGDNFQFRNRGRGTIEGVEAEMQTAFAEIWSLEAGLAVSDGGTDGNAEIDDIAPPNGWLTLRCSSGRAFAFGRVATFLEQDEPGPTELARPGYTLFDVGGGYRFTDAIELRLLVRNAGDKRYYGAADNAADRATGRIVSVALSGRI